ncbi:hypothetical protein [Candidatus Albibeggiatoa sp. nov. NOAA]|uniref:hypothetical protein n=1 Tax=Candidatus Albibeggiatoa sp. nov. NOAA TaxID=3162724 RepID=UPI0032F96189|nr:hypothetical protein [Thiotrichaceae bacterium]
MTDVLSCGELGLQVLQNLLSRYKLEVILVSEGQDIEGSFWGDSEAGLVENRLYIRDDTPVHSALHEACHYICMDAGRRNALHTDAGGDYDEENGVCYLQILLSEHLSNVTKQKAWADMDAWGYSFRLGSTQAWFEQDAEDARQWLLKYDLIDTQDQPTWKLRQT